MNDERATGAHPGILFRPEMARAIVAGRKRQTRRLIDWDWIEPGANHAFSGLEAGYYGTDAPTSGWVLRSRNGNGCWNDRTRPAHCRYAAGSLCTVLTTWAVDRHFDQCNPLSIDPQRVDLFWHAGMGPKLEKLGRSRAGRFCPTIFRHLMPTIRIESSRPDLLQRITEEDAIAEGATQREGLWSLDWSRLGTLSRFAGGIHPRGHGMPITEKDIGLQTARFAFANYWDRINEKDGHGWGKNDWVWVVAFRLERT